MSNLRRMNSLGAFIEHLLNQRNWSNRELAQQADVSESAVRNLLKFGIDENAREPSPSIISQVAEALNIDAVILFRLAGYIKPAQKITLDAEYLIDMYQQLHPEGKDTILAAVRGILNWGEAPLRERLYDVQHISEESDKISGAAVSEGLKLFYYQNPQLIRAAANKIMLSGIFSEVDADMVLLDVKPENIPMDFPLGGHTFGDLPRSMQERIVAVIIAKIEISYDPEDLLYDVKR